MELSMVLVAFAGLFWGIGDGLAGVGSVRRITLLMLFFFALLVVGQSLIGPGYVVGFSAVSLYKMWRKS